jgi:hypothetical protein
MKAMQDDGKTLEEIGLPFGLSRQRVEQIFTKPPRKPGPPFQPGKVEELRGKLALWERRRAVRVEKGKPTVMADERIAALTKEIGEVQTAERP